MIAMNICPYCEHHNRPGVLICERCGHSSSIFASLPTRVIPDEISPTGPRWQGTDRFTPDTFVVMHIEGVREPLVLPLDKPTLLGRANEITRQYPDIDLTPYGAFEKGVSSRHLLLERGDGHLLLTDMGSTNGTYLNGQRLNPNEAAVVHDGVEVRLGKLVIHLYFESAACAPASGEASTTGG